jgi:hypothetical protein
MIIRDVDCIDMISDSEDLEPAVQGFLNIYHSEAPV